MNDKPKVYKALVTKLDNQESLKKDITTLTDELTAHKSDNYSSAIRLQDQINRLKADFIDIQKELQFINDKLKSFVISWVISTLSLLAGIVTLVLTR